MLKRSMDSGDMAEMKCERIRYLISRSLDGDISARQLMAVERHLEQCSRCSVVAHDLKRIVGELSSVPAERAPAGLAFAIESRVAARPACSARVSFGPWYRSVVRAVYASAALLVLVIAGGAYLRARADWSRIRREVVVRTVDAASAHAIALAAVDPLEDITIANALHGTELPRTVLPNE